MAASDTRAPSGILAPFAKGRPACGTPKETRVPVHSPFSSLASYQYSDAAADPVRFQVPVQPVKP